MTPATTITAPKDSTSTVRGRGVRQLVESLVCLALAVVLFRTFEVEGYMITTGSMAPHLLGFHKRVICPRCGYRFAFGVSYNATAAGNSEMEDADVAASHGSDRIGRSSKHRQTLAVCPNCGAEAIDTTAILRNQGDQLLVYKHAYLFHAPRRWEVVVFRNPNRPTQAYVKRVVGLPGEAVQIRDGDVFIDGELQRKRLAIQRALRILVADHDHRPHDDAEWRPQWVPEPNASQPGEPQWKAVGSRFVLDGGPSEQTGGLRANVSSSSPSAWAWVAYRHWTRDGRPGPITDDYAYNAQSDAPPAVPVHDLMLAAEVTIQQGDGRFVIRMTDGRHSFDCELDAGTSQVALKVDGTARPVRSSRLPPETLQQPMLWEMSLFDQQVTVGVNGRPLWDGWKIPVTGSARPSGGASRTLRASGTLVEPLTSPVRFGACGLTVSVGSLKLFRDVYYRSDAPATVRHGIDKPFRLGPDEYFVLGDNSPVSSDSRSWPHGAVPKHLLLGKPLVVHLPSRPGKIRLGRWTAHIRIPDFTRIRYIR